MKHIKSIRKIFLITIIVLIGLSAQVIADRGMGHGPYSRWGHHRMHALHHGEYEGSGFGYQGDLSEEDIEKLEKERSNFFEATKNLRAEIYQKRLELRSELAKENPDAKKAAELQTEISEMKAEFDQKRLNHFFNMRKISPDIGRGFGGSYGMIGPGMMEPRAMGPEGYGGRHCLNCPYGSYRGSPGMGPGMMGSGMRGPGWKEGKEPHASGRSYRQKAGRQTGALEEKDAKKIVENYIKNTRNPNLELGKIEDAGNAFEVEIVTKEKSLVEKVLVDKQSRAMRSQY